jgi:hypothetical protein
MTAFSDLRESAEALLKRPGPLGTANLLYQLIVRLDERAKKNDSQPNSMGDREHGLF